MAYQHAVAALKDHMYEYNIVGEKKIPLKGWCAFKMNHGVKVN